MIAGLQTRGLDSGVEAIAAVETLEIGAFLGPAQFPDSNQVLDIGVGLRFRRLGLVAQTGRSRALFEHGIAQSEE